MPHLASRARVLLAVEMQLCISLVQQQLPVRSPQVAQKIHHHDRRQQADIPGHKPANHARLLLELRGHAGVLAVMTAVVRARRHLVE